MLAVRRMQRWRRIGAALRQMVRRALGVVSRTATFVASFGIDAVLTVTAHGLFLGALVDVCSFFRHKSILSQEEDLRDQF